MTIKNFQDIDLDQKITGISFFSVNTKISSGKMHGQSDNIKPLGFVTISVNNKTGISEIYAATYISVGLKSIFEYLDHLLKDKSLLEAIDIFENLQIPFVSRNGLFKACIGALENAFLDMCAKLNDVPLYKFLEGEKEFPKIYASGGSVICSPKEIEEESYFVENDGYHGYKIRAGLQSWEIDKKRIKAMKNISINKMVDGICGTRNPCWSVSDVIPKISFLEDQNIYWLEEPLYPDNYSDHALLQEATLLNIAAGEAYSGFGEFKNLIDIGKINIIQFDACHSGGISLCKKISEYATYRKRKTAIHVWGSSVAINTNFHLALSIKELDFLEKPLIELEIDKMIHQEYRGMENLKNTIIEKPGIGIEIEDFADVPIDNSFGYEYKW